VFPETSIASKVIVGAGFCFCTVGGGAGTAAAGAGNVFFTSGSGSGPVLDGAEIDGVLCTGGDASAGCTGVGVARAASSRTFAPRLLFPFFVPVLATRVLDDERGISKLLSLISERRFLRVLFFFGELGLSVESGAAGDVSAAQAGAASSRARERTDVFRSARMESLIRENGGDEHREA